MKTDISIPATLETKRLLHVWTCYPHQIPRIMVDLENFYEVFELPDDVANTHEDIVDFIKHRGVRDSLNVILAYQALEVEIIRDDRTKWGHEPSVTQTTRRAKSLTSKTFVYTSKFGCPTMSLEQIREDAAWVTQHSGKPRFSASEARSEKQARDKRVTVHTVQAWEKLRDEYWEDQSSGDIMFIKLGPATYIPVCAEIPYRAVPGLNPEPKR